MFKNNNDRNAIRKKALEEPKGTLAKALLCIAVIGSLISFFLTTLMNVCGYSKNIEILNVLLFWLPFVIISPLIFNLMNMVLLNSRDEIYSFRDLFRFTKKSFGYTFVFSILLLGCILGTYILGLLPFVGFIFNFLIIVYLLPIFIFLPFVYLDNKGKGIRKNILKTFKLLEGRRISFYGMFCSFIPFVLIGLATAGVLYLWLIPYMLITFSYQYLSWNYEEEYNKNESLSNGMLIFITFIVFAILTIISFVNIPSSFNNFVNDLLNYKVLESKGDSTLEYSGAVVTFDKPSGYKLSQEGITTKTYINEDNYNVVQYSIYMADEKDIMKVDKEEFEGESFTITAGGKKLNGYKYINNGENNIVVYYPKGAFVITVSLSNAEKKLSKKDIEEFINIY